MLSEPLNVAAYRCTVLHSFHSEHAAPNGVSFSYAFKING